MYSWWRKSRARSQLIRNNVRCIPERAKRPMVVCAPGRSAATGMSVPGAANATHLPGGIGRVGAFSLTRPRFLDFRRR